MDSFFLMGARPLVEASPSMKLHELLDWDAIAGQLTGLCGAQVSCLIKGWNQDRKTLSAMGDMAKGKT